MSGLRDDFLNLRDEMREQIAALKQEVAGEREERMSLEKEVRNTVTSS